MELYIALWPHQTPPPYSGILQHGMILSHWISRITTIFISIDPSGSGHQSFKKCSKTSVHKNVLNPHSINLLPCHLYLPVNYCQMLDLEFLKSLTFTVFIYQWGPSTPKTQVVLPRLKVDLLSWYLTLTYAYLSLLFPSRY